MEDPVPYPHILLQPLGTLPRPSINEIEDSHYYTSAQAQHALEANDMAWRRLKRKGALRSHILTWTTGEGTLPDAFRGVDLTLAEYERLMAAGYLLIVARDMYNGAEIKALAVSLGKAVEK